MAGWFEVALDYIPRWIGYQMAAAEQPGAVVAVAHKGKVVLEQAFGVADLATGAPMMPRHRFRVASHSKTFTAVGALRLREMGKLGLDDAVGRYVSGLHPGVATATIGQLLSHAAGLARDGADSGAFADRRPFLTLAELKADLAQPQPLGAAETFKYSNHGIALVGHVIEVVTGEAYTQWIAREVVKALALKETSPDVGGPGGGTGPLASGHTTRLPYGRRLVVPGRAPTNDMAAATGFVSTAGDLVKFFAALLPSARKSILSPVSRREMSRRHWRDRHAAIERYYGLGTIIGAPGAWSWWGHSGGFQGTLTRTCVIPDHEIAISVLTNAVDGPSQAWVDGIIHILRTLHGHGGGEGPASDWSGRYWNLWGAFDLVPAGPDTALLATPSLGQPFLDASVIAVEGRDHGRVAEAQAFGDLAEGVRRERSPTGDVAAVWVGGKKLLPESSFRAEVEGRYGG